MRKRPKTAKRKRGLYTAEPQRHRVIARRIAGQTYREIAKGEGIDRGPVARILGSAEATQLLTVLPLDYV